jgi:hypothetical protein
MKGRMMVSDEVGRRWMELIIAYMKVPEYENFPWETKETNK